jgi:hypothetical protein
MIDHSNLRPLILSDLKPPMNITLVTPDSGLPELSRKEKHRIASLSHYRRHKEMYHTASKKWRRNNPERAMWLRAKHHALKVGVPFSIEVSDISIPKFCPVLGIALENAENRDNRPSLDRVVCELGYVPGNVQVISQRANRIKSDATVEELTKILEYIKCSMSQN